MINGLKFENLLSFISANLFHNKAVKYVLGKTVKGHIDFNLSMNPYNSIEVFFAVYIAAITGLNLFILGQYCSIILESILAVIGLTLVHN